MNAPTITLIAARARNGVIGRDNQMPWRISGEQAYFKRMTMGHPIVMGRKTWESIGRALPGRRNIVVTRNARYQAPGAEVVGSLDAALALIGHVDEVFVIGGAQLYAEAMPRADRLLLTEIDADIEGDTVFPPFDRSQWRETRRDCYPAMGDLTFGHAFVVYQRQ